MQYLKIVRQYAHDHPQVSTAAGLVVGALLQYIAGYPNAAAASLMSAAGVLGIRVTMWTNPNPPVKQA